jgi:hypothetical protein
MKNPAVFFLPLFLIGAIVRYFTSEISSTIRTVDFLQIFTIGLLSGVLLILLTNKFRNKNL